MRRTPFFRDGIPEKSLCDSGSTTKGPRRNKLIETPIAKCSPLRTLDCRLANPAD